MVCVYIYYKFCELFKFYELFIVSDYIDIVKDPISSGDYRKDEDPKIFKSKKTGRGPLNDNWREEYTRAAKSDPNKKIMTAYKLCRVEFRYWGMQNKIERFIHDIGELQDDFDVFILI